MNFLNGNKLKSLTPEFVKFSVVGASNFVITFALFNGSLYFFEARYILSLLIAWTVGVTLSYAANYIWVFKPEKIFNMRIRFIKYITSNAFSLAINIVYLLIMVEFNVLDAFYAQIIFIPIIMWLNYTLARYWSLKK